MKKQFLTAMFMLAVFALVVTPSISFAQAGHWGQGAGGFIDENGDGFNDLAPDADGDGIPNALDEDYVPVGAGNGAGNGTGEFIDEDGDGYNDLAPDADGDGIPNGMDDDYVAPQNGTGAGAGYGAGDGTGTGAGHGSGRGNGIGGGQGPADGMGPGSGDCIVEPAQKIQKRINTVIAR